MCVTLPFKNTGGQNIVSYQRSETFDSQSEHIDEHTSQIDFSATSNYVNEMIAALSAL